MKKTVIVAVSAGPDSMALLHMLQQENLNIVVAHVNYHQRKTSTRDETCVFEYAKEHNLKFEKKDFDIEVKGNFQSLARDFRYGFFKTLYNKYEASTLYLGHHLDDDLETFVMQKNANRVTDYPGIKEKSIMMGMNIERPLLHLSKYEIIQYCHKHNIPFEIDETNLETEYTRNKVRSELSKITRQEKEKLIHELQLAKEEKEAYLSKLETLENPFIIQEYLNYDKNIRIDMLRNYLQENGVQTFEFTKEYILELDRQIEGGKAQIPIQEKTLSVSYNEVMLHSGLSYSYTIYNTKPHKTQHYEIRDKGEVIEGLTVSEKDFPLTIRSTKPNDKIELRYGTKSVNRFLIDRKIPIHKRATWLVVENSMKDIVFVVGIGCDIHHYSNNPSLFMIKLLLS